MKNRLSTYLCMNQVYTPSNKKNPKNHDFIIFFEYLFLSLVSVYITCKSTVYICTHDILCHIEIDLSCSSQYSHIINI